METNKPLRHSFAVGQVLKIQITDKVLEEYRISRRGHQYLDVQRVNPVDSDRKPITRIKMNDARIIN
jgi:hypothetical protein